MNTALVVAVVSSLSAWAMVPPSVPGTPATEAPSVLAPAVLPASAEADLGPAFESELSAVAFRPPAGMTREGRVIGGTSIDLVASYVDTVHKRKLTLTQVVFGDKVALLTPKEGLQVGFLDQRTDALKETPGAEVLRSEPYTIGFRSAKGEPDSGLIAVRYAAGTADLFAQEAIVQISPYEYYLLNYTVPGSKSGSGKESVSDEERAAAMTFQAMIGSVKVIDRSAVRRDQDERKLRTRFLFFTNLSANRIRNVLRGEQWYRVVRDGKDVGYSYVVEEEGEKNKRPGFTVGVRTRVLEGPDQIDAESFFFSSYDRAYEEWSTVSQVSGGKDVRQNTTELGTSTRTERKVLDKNAVRIRIDAKDNEPLTKVEIDYDLTVVYGGRGTTPPVQQQLPVFYLPGAMQQILPRLVSLGDARTYMFATYVSEVRGVMREYVDVGKEGTFELGGKSIRAVPVDVRLGLTGSVTTHYVSRDGKYLGSTNEKTKTQYIPADQATLEKLWVTPDLSKPKPAKVPGGSLTPGR